jgi:hypothetical protein
LLVFGVLFRVFGFLVWHRCREGFFVIGTCFYSA